jgi:hypothetical protein
MRTIDLQCVLYCPNEMSELLTVFYGLCALDNLAIPENIGLFVCLEHESPTECVVRGVMQYEFCTTHWRVNSILVDPELNPQSEKSLIFRILDELLDCAYRKAISLRGNRKTNRVKLPFCISEYQQQDIVGLWMLKRENDEILGYSQYENHLSYFPDDPKRFRLNARLSTLGAKDWLADTRRQDLHFEDEG